MVHQWHLPGYVAAALELSPFGLSVSITRCVIPSGRTPFMTLCWHGDIEAEEERETEDCKESMRYGQLRNHHQKMNGDVFFDSTLKINANRRRAWTFIVRQLPYVPPVCRAEAPITNRLRDYVPDLEKYKVV